jgi:hypothetical protein
MLAKMPFLSDMLQIGLYFSPVVKQLHYVSKKSKHHHSVSGKQSSTVCLDTASLYVLFYEIFDIGIWTITSLNLDGHFVVFS